MNSVRLRLGARGVGPLVIALTSLACAGTLDLGRARQLLNPPRAEPLPTLSASEEAGLPEPEGLRARSGELREIPLRWQPLLGGDVAGYVIERSSRREGPFTRVGATAGRTLTSWVDRGPNRYPGVTGSREALEDGQTRFYRVRAFGSRGAVSLNASAVATATTAPPPDPPEEVRAYSHQPREVPLSWEPSEDPQVAGYVILRSPTSQGPFEDIGEVEGRHASVYLDRGLGDLRVFYYQVVSVNAAGGRGAPSPSVRAVTKAEPLPPLDLRVEQRQLGSNTLAWEPNVETDIASYRLLRLRQGSDTPERVAEPAAGFPSGIDAAVGAGETVRYTAIAIDENGLESAPSEPIEVVSVGYELEAQVRPDGVHLRWNPRSDEGWTAARVYLHTNFTEQEIGISRDGRFVHALDRPGRRRYTVVLEAPGGRRAPRSSPIEITVP